MCLRRAGLFLSGPRVPKGRFVSPWDRLGKSKEELFGGVLTSANPIQRLKRESKRQQELEEEVEAATLADDPTLQRDFRIAQEAAAERAKAFAEQDAFLPLGVVPHPHRGDGTWGVRQPPPLSAEPRSAAALEEMFSSGIHPSWSSGRAGIVFDIDGVLRDGEGAIDGTGEMLRYLQAHKIPFLLMTNGGGFPVHTATQHLSRQFHAELSPSQVLLGSAPMAYIAPTIKGSVLVVGPPSAAAEAAKELGFRHVVTTAQLRHDYPEYVPLSANRGPPMPPGEPLKPFPAFDAVVVLSAMHCDAFADIQLIIDVLLSPNGRVTGAVSPMQSVPLLFAADDFLFASASSVCPRLGPGAFREMLAAVYEAVSGQQLHIIPYGKPRRVNFLHALRTLKQQAAAMHKHDGLEAVFMVGDNSDTDVVGANAAGLPWVSVLVDTGLNGARAAVRSAIEGDDEATWMLNHVRREPSLRCSNAVDFIVSSTQRDVADVVREVRREFTPPCPVDINAKYNFPRW